MLTTKNPIRCQIPPQQGAAVGVVLSFGADLIPILNLDAALGEAKLTIYPGVGHNSWSETYANPKLYEWLLSHTR
jgi:hypothetical protein